MSNSALSLDGKVALVTGGGAGIGRASSIALSSAGAKLVVSDINKETGQETVTIIKDAGGDATFVHCDVANSASVEQLIAATVTQYGRLDCAHNNAGGGSGVAPMHEYSEQDWDRTMAVNLKSVWLCMRAEVKQMLNQGGGAIVNTSSVAGLRGMPGALYSASKHGVVGLSKSAAVEYAAQGIRVNSICPGPTDTAMGAGLKSLPPEELNTVLPPMKRFANASEMATMVVFLCSDAASYMTGQSIAIDGGATAS